MRNLRSELEEFNGEYAPSWKLEEGAIVVGRIKSYSQALTNYGEAWVCTIEEETQGPLSIWLTSTVLIDQFKRLKPKVGERVGIKCLGKHPERKYWRFIVRVDRPEQGPDFESIQGWDRPPQDDPPF
ncbi:MAG: hypothetical protein DDT19_00783 [Syntrophomonadaceae bacterium]|nr:hypothetical protein [Bacillota bacterium]